MRRRITYTLPENLDQVLGRLMVLAMSGERTAPAHFVGRMDIREHIAGRIAAHLIDDHPADCLTEVIQGAPGVGKTSLMHQLQVEHEINGIAVVRMEGNALNDRLSFTEKFVDGFGASLQNKRTSQTRKSIGVNKMLHHTFRSEKATLPLSEQLERDTNVWRIALNNMNLRYDEKIPSDTLLAIPPVLLLVDEAQRVRAGPEGDYNTICTDLHALETGRFKVLPVFAGLGDTVTRLSLAGLSRLDRCTRTLDKLSIAEYEEAVSGLFETEEMSLSPMFDADTKKRVANNLAIASEGWPRHLHCYMRAFAEVLSEDLRQGPTCKLDLAEVLDRGHLERIEYCQQRLSMSKLDDGFVSVLVELMKNNAGDTLSQAAMQSLGQDAFQFTRKEVDENIAHATHAGVLDRVPHEHPPTYKFPIPSFAAYMREQCDRERVLEHMRETHAASLG